MIRALALLGLLVVGLTGCSGAQLQSGPPQETLGFDVEDYRIGVGDNLKVNVWRNENLSVDVPVRPDGKISMPLLGDVLAADKSAEGLATEITERLQKFVRNPQVTVIITNPASSDFQQRVRVTGAVQSPQSIPFRKGMTVLDLVLLAGGPNEFSASDRSKLYRRVAGEVKIYPVRLDDILHKGDLTTNYTLLPSDIVTVPERSF